MTTVYERILHPEETLDEIKEELFSLYEQDYGKYSRKTMEQRWNNTFFIFDATPIELRELLLSNKIKNKKSVLRMEIEYVDYRRVQKRVEESAKEEFKEYLTDRFHIFKQEDMDDLWNGKTKDPRWNDYMQESILNKKKELDFKSKKELVRRTIWGKRIKKKCKTLTDEQLAEILFNSTLTASTNVLLDKNITYKTVCFIPLAKHINVPSLDRIVLHELRHVVETENNRSGLCFFEDFKYDRLNEVRTEKNAQRDEARLPIIFGRRKTGPQSLYEVYLNRLQGLDIYEELLNVVAFIGNIDSAREEIDSLNERIQEESKKIQKVLRG